MTRIINLTQHAATPDQQREGVFEPQLKEKVKELLTFKSVPTVEEITSRAVQLAFIAKDEGADAAMIGGAPYLMRALEDALIMNGIEPVYAFSVREAVETQNPDGSVVKRMVFRHAGWVRPFKPKP